MIHRMTEKATVIAYLGVVVLIVVIAGAILSYNGKSLDGEIKQIGAGALGALATFISRTNGVKVRRVDDEPDDNHRKQRVGHEEMA